MLIHVIKTSLVVTWNDPEKEVLLETFLQWAHSSRRFADWWWKPLFLPPQDLIGVLKEQLSDHFKDVMVGLMYPPPSYDAHELWHAMKVVIWPRNIPEAGAGWHFQHFCRWADCPRMFRHTCVTLQGGRRDYVSSDVTVEMLQPREGTGQEDRASGAHGWGQPAVWLDKPRLTSQPHDELPKGMPEMSPGPFRFASPQCVFVYWRGCVQTHVNLLKLSLKTWFVKPKWDGKLESKYRCDLALFLWP